MIRKAKKDKRFEIVHKDSISMAQEAIVIKDKETGVHYLFFASGYGGGLTPLLDKDRKPLIDERISFE
jgi:hypothetical protein